MRPNARFTIMQCFGSKSIIITFMNAKVSNNKNKDVDKAHILAAAVHGTHE